MKVATTAERLNYLMRERKLKQCDILTLTEPICEKYGLKMNKSNISQYVSGKISPNQDKLFILGEALGVDPVWLMGADVPMVREKVEYLNVKINNDEFELLELYRQADPIFQAEAIDMLKRHPKK